MTSTVPSVSSYQEGVLADVRAGLGRTPKELPPKYFYDLRGSELFEEITRLPEYYLTRAERRLLASWMPSLMEALRPATLVELGAGSGEKTRIILRAMHAALGASATYVPMDVSADFLDESAARLRDEYPWVSVAPVVGDFTVEMAIPDDRNGTTLFAFLGSTIGNFAPLAAVQLLRGVREAMHDDDRLLLGADLRTKPVSRIEAAYNDGAGVTAEFNQNMLRVLNRELGADFAIDVFHHLAFYSSEHHRVEMHLMACGNQEVTIPHLGTIVVRDGESIRTEICCKYDRQSLEDLLALADMRITDWRVDSRDQYALLLAQPASTVR
ncbi:MAG: L-histidine N(alpha)-methyltransferase [Gemmatimonadaceae bacterium]